MAYNPTTWGSNDVITKDRLNKMEQGVRTGTLLSGTDIDADKDWAGKNITNVGALDTLTGNVGARTGFVDVPGDVLRQTFTPNITINSQETKTIVSFTVPPDYSAEIASNLRIGITKTVTMYTMGMTFTAEINGVEIGELYLSAYEHSYGNLDTTGGCKAGDTIVIKAMYGGDGRNNPVIITKVEVKSARKSDVPAYKVFAETGAW